VFYCTGVINLHNLHNQDSILNWEKTDMDSDMNLEIHEALLHWKKVTGVGKVVEFVRSHPGKRRTHSGVADDLDKAGIRQGQRGAHMRAGNSSGETQIRFDHPWSLTFRRSVAS